jgi:hypothetical protein
MNELLQLGAATCNWLGLTKGRFYQCLELAKDFHERSHHSRNHIYAYQELHEMVVVYQLLKSQAHKYPGLTEKVRQVFTKGPMLRVNETKENNKARNNLFTYYLAGRLMKAGINVVAVDECVLPEVSRPTRSDIAIIWRELYLEFECKRPVSRASLEGNVKEASSQLKKNLTEGGSGVIAIDCSGFVPATVGPEGKKFADRLSRGSPEDTLNDYLLEQVSAKIRSKLEINILGLLLFIRLPSFSAIIMNQDMPGGRTEPASYFRASNRLHFLFFQNVNSRMASRFEEISNYLKVRMGSTPLTRFSVMI